MPKVQFDHAVTFEGHYYQRGYTYEVTKEQRIALGTEAIDVKDTFGLKITMQPSKGVQAPKVDKMVHAAPKAKEAKQSKPAKPVTPPTKASSEAKEAANEGGTSVTVTPETVNAAPEN